MPILVIQDCTNGFFKKKQLINKLNILGALQLNQFFRRPYFILIYKEFKTKKNSEY